MREILFRAKPVSGEDWVEGVPIQHSDGDWQIRGGYSNAGYSVTVDPKTICQYTGMTNRHGKKIFEGDIIKYHFGEVTAHVKFGSYQSCFDSQKTEHCGFYVDWKSERNFRKDLGYWVHMVDAEIVGNVIDNPELAKEV